MAGAFKASLGSNFNNVSGTTLAITTTAAIAVDDFVVVRWAADNLSATTPTATCADTSNTYTVLRQAAVNATAAAGCAGGMLATKATVAKPAGSTITLTFSGAILGKAAYVESFTGVDNTVRSAAVGATGTATAASAGASGTVNAGDLVLGFIANETRTAITADSDTLNGSWSTQVSVLGGGTSGQDATSVTIAGQYKFATATGAQTYNVTAVASEWVIGCLVMQATPDPAISLAAYGFFDDAGTESGAAALAAQNTAITGNLANGDGFGVLRVRLQSTTAQAVPVADDFQVQWEKNASGTWAAAQLAGAEAISDSYPETNQVTIQTLWASNNNLVGQSFLGDGKRLTKAEFWLQKGGTPTGFATAYLYSHTGTFGSTYTLGSVLATATTSLDVSTLSTAFGWSSFTFDGSYTLTAGTAYFIVIAYNGGTSSNLIRVGTDDTAPTHPGNAATNFGSATVYDICFRVYTAPSATTVVPYDNPNLTDGAATTNRLTGGTGTFVAGKVSETGDVPNMGWAGNNYTELVYSLKLLAANFSKGDVVRFRVLRNGSTTAMTYSVTPTINISAPYNEKLLPLGITATVTAADVKRSKELAVSSDAYLNATIGVVTTADFGTLPDTGFVFVWKARGPTTTTQYDTKVLASQMPGDPQRSWELVRDGSNGNVIMTCYSTGTQFPSTSIIYDSPAAVNRSVPEYLAASYLKGGGPSGFGQARTYQSTDGGATYTQKTNLDYGSAPLWFFDSTAMVVLGATGPSNNEQVWDDRICWVELRTGTDPKAGTVLWRFDASEYPGSGMNYTDPRSRQWFLSTAGVIIAASTTMTMSVAVTVTCTDTYTGAAASVNYNETGRSITIVAATTAPTERAGRKELALTATVAAATTAPTEKLGNKELALAITAAAATTVTDRAGRKDLALSVPIAGSNTLTDRAGNKELARSVAVTATCTLPTNQAHYKESGGAAASPYLFTDDWNTADAPNWDFFKWPHQHPYDTISGGKGVVTSGGSPNVVYADQYVTDFEMTVKVEWQSSIAGQYPEIAWRIYDAMTSNSSAGYVVQIDGSATSVYVYKIGAYTSIGGVASSPGLGAAGVRWFKIRVVGNNHKVKWWTDGSAEPGTWQIDATDASPPNDQWGFPVTGGGIGFRLWGGTPILVDDLTIIDLASPPTPALDGSLRMLSRGQVLTKAGDTNVFASDTDLSWCCWFMVTNAPAGVAIAVIFSLYNNSTGYCTTYVESDLTIRQSMTEGATTTGYTISPNTWYFVAMSRSMTGGVGTDIYYAPQGGALTKTHTANKGTVTGLPLWLLSNNNGADPYMNGAAFKIWTAALTQADFAAEMATYSAVRTANLWASYPMRNGMDYRSENPVNSNLDLAWAGGAMVSGPVVTGLLDAPVAPSGGAGLALTVAATVTGIDVPGTGAQHFIETGRSILIAASVTTTDVTHRKELALALPVVATTTTTDLIHRKELNLALTAGTLSSAISISAAGQRFSRSASGLTLATTSITWCAWAKLTTQGSYAEVLSSDDANTHYCQMGVSSGGLNFYLANAGSSVYNFTPGSTWVFIAATIDRTGTECWLYYAPAPATTLSRDFFFTVPTSHFLDTNTFYVGSDGFGASWLGSIAGVKVWNAVLTQAELTAEAAKYDPVRTANLWAAYSFRNGPQTNDESGNGRTLIQTGTPGTDTSGPLSAPGATVTITVTDVVHRKELALALAGVVTTTTTNVLHDRELALSVSVAATTTATDRLNNKELSLSVPVAATVTVTDIIHVGGVGFNETGRSITIVGAVTTTDRQANKEPGLSVAVTAAVTPTAKQTSTDLGLSVPVTGTVTATDLIHRKEIGLSVPVTATVAVTDLVHRKELGLSVAVVATTTTTDLPRMREVLLTVPVTAATNVTERSSYQQLLLSVGVVTTITISDAYSHLGNFSEINRSVPIGATTTLVEAAHLREISLSVAASATTALTDSCKRRELNLPTTAVATTTLSVDQADFEDHPVTLSIVAFVTVVDLQQSPGHFDETQRSILVAVTTTLAVDQTDYDQLALAVTATATTALVDTAHRRDLSLTITAAATVTVTDIPAGHINETLRSVAVTATVTSTDRAHFRDPLGIDVAAAASTIELARYHSLSLAVGVAVSVATTDSAHRPETTSIFAAATFSSIERASYRQLALPVGTTATVSVLNSLRSAFALSIFIATVITMTDVRSRTGVVILNNADALFLGDEEVFGVYVGADRAWP